MRDARGLTKAMKSDRSWSRACEIADAAAKEWSRKPAVGTASTIIAGRQLDLSGVTACSAPACLQRELDEGLATVWQYFDRVVVEGLAARQFLRQASHPEFAKARLISHSSIYLHAKAIGALPHLISKEKPHAFCADHYKEHAKELGLPAVLDGKLALSIARKLATEGRFEVLDLGSVVNYFFAQPLFDAGLCVTVPSETVKEAAITPFEMAKKDVRGLHVSGRLATWLWRGTCRCP